MIAFIEEHQGEFGVEPTCRVLPITPSSCYRHAALARDPDSASDRARQDAADLKEIKRVHDESKVSVRCTRCDGLFECLILSTIDSGHCEVRDDWEEGLLDDTGVRSFKYLYDFGDGREHKIRIGKVASDAAGQLYPQLTSIEGRCPPEDIGGPPGYAHFLEVMVD